jgi:hypothetical protein
VGLRYAAHCCGRYHASVATAVSTREGIGFGGFALRFVFAVVLVYATYNPTGYSYFQRLVGSFSDEITPSSWLASPAH